jgi:hypothetical protein
MHDELDEHYRRYRDEVERRLDAEYREFRASRAAPENAPLAPPGEGALESFGRAVAEVFTAPESAGSNAGLREELVERERRRGAR